MSITLTGSEGLFTRLGRVGKLVYRWNDYQSGIRTVCEALYDQYPNDYKYLGGMPAAEQGLTRSEAGLLSIAQGVALDTLIGMVVADQPTVPPRLEDCLRELIRQMVASSDTVKRCTVAATPTAGTNTGDGVMRTTVTRGDGLPIEHTPAETASLKCVGDSQSGTATAGSEPFTFYGEANEAGVLDYDWPQGSGVQFTIQAVSPDANTLLTNGGFDTWTAGNPDNWTNSGTTEDVAGYSGSAPLFPTGGAHSLTQVLNDATTGNALTPQTVYGVNLWAKRSGVTSAGVLKIELVNGSGTVINDDQGVANSITINHGDLTTSWQAFGGWFRTPRVLTDDIDIRIKATTNFAGANAVVDHVTMAQPNGYTGGYGLLVFSGATKFVVNDSWTVASTNNRGGASLNATWQTLFDRLFNMARYGLQLPSTAGSPTIADTLITS